MFVHCPTAAAACFILISFGFSLRCILLAPTAIAPDETRMTSCPMFWMSERTIASFSIVRRLLFPSSFVRVDVPTLITILSLFAAISFPFLFKDMIAVPLPAFLTYKTVSTAPFRRSHS